MVFKFLRYSSGNGGWWPLPVCPKCGKTISKGRVSRHRSRCGKKPTIRKVVTDENVVPAML